MIDSLNSEITRVAYELYEKSNREEGNDLFNWLAAEKIVNFRRTLFPDYGREAIPLLEYKPEYARRSVRPTPGRARRAQKSRYAGPVGKGA